MVVQIRHIGVNVSALDGISEKEFINAFKGHYKQFSNRDDLMKTDYKELKKYFTKKRVKKEPQE